MSLLTDEEIHEDYKALRGDKQPRYIEIYRAAEAVILAKLASAELPEPESFEAWNAKQHGDPEEIGFLQALRIAYCSGQDSVNARQAYAQGAAAQLNRLEKAEKDAARLDWLDKFAHLATWVDNEPTKLVIDAASGDEFKGDTWRAAIDAAMEAK